MQRDDELLTAVEDLVKPQRSKVIQDGPVGSGLDGQRSVVVVLPPLLDQLCAAIYGSNVKGSSGSLASQRNILDGDALMQFARISSQIGDWARMVKAEVVKGDPKLTLNHWYVKYVYRQPELASERFHVKQLRGWASQISAKLNPANVRELPDACPVCGADKWFNPADKLPYLHPLIIRYYPSGADMIQHAEALCRFCEATWGIRELAFLLETREQETA